VLASTSAQIKYKFDSVATEKQEEAEEEAGERKKSGRGGTEQVDSSVREKREGSSPVGQFCGDCSTFNVQHAL
jgi:hypothetical protein